jgi:hypothetical protein
VHALEGDAQYRPVEPKHPVSHCRDRLRDSKAESFVTTTSFLLQPGNGTNDEVIVQKLKAFLWICVLTS